jgi:hypothetical protein
MKNKVKDTTNGDDDKSGDAPRDDQTIHHWVARMDGVIGRRNALRRGTVYNVIEIGETLMEIKSRFPRQFEAVIADNEERWRFGPRTARRYMAIASDERIRTHGSEMPPSWRTLYELTRLGDDEWAARLEDGTINPDMERADIEKRGVPGKSKKWGRPKVGMKRKKNDTRLEALNSAIRHLADIGIDDVRALMQATPPDDVLKTRAIWRQHLKAAHDLLASCMNALDGMVTRTGGDRR